MDIRARLNRLDELANERWLGISTAEFHEQHDSCRPDFRGYAPTFYRDWRIIRRHLKPRGIFIDYGAGLGRATILAARLPFDRVIGVDLDADLVERGNRNIDRARGLKCDAEIICQNATTFPIPSDASTLYFCNPFSGSVLAAVIDKVRDRSLQLVCNVPPSGAFEYEMKSFRWLAPESEIGLTNGRKCLIFTSQGKTTL